MDIAQLETTIEEAWETRGDVSASTTGAVRDAVEAALALLDTGAARVAEKTGGDWVVNQWLKKAVLLSFRLNDMTVIPGGPGNASWWDKVPSKFEGWTAAEFGKAGFRAVPNCVVRRSAHIAQGVVLMPSFVNLGAFVDEGTMVDTWATVGSCAQIGKNCHISGGAGIGGVLEPLQAGPVIIEDNCFIGARAEVAEGVIVREGSVLSMGVYLGASTKIVDRATGEIFSGEVPPYSVVVSGTMPGKPFPDGTPGPGSTAPSSSSASTSRRAPRPLSTNCCAIERHQTSASAPHRAPGDTTVPWVLFGFDGRIGREVYWLGIGLIWCVLIVGLGYILSTFGEEAAGGPVLVLGMLALWAEIALLVKRLHDRGMPGFWALLAFIPFAGFLWVVIVGVLPGMRGPNVYGPGPDTRGPPPPGPANDNGAD